MSLFELLFPNDSDRKRRADIDDLKDRARRQQILTKGRNKHYENEVSMLKSQVENLELQVGELQLLTRALLEQLKQRDDWDEATFQKILFEIDLEDGVQDGRISPPDQ